ncbi:hypothetical protein KI387_033525, partial [Taxus chinensis]
CFFGWTVAPNELRFSNGFLVANNFNRVMCTCFNGASNIAQAGGLPLDYLSPKGLKVLKKRKRSEEWEKKRKQELENTKTKNAKNHQLIFKRDEQYLKEYMDR